MADNKNFTFTVGGKSFDISAPNKEIATKAFRQNVLSKQDKTLTGTLQRLEGGVEQKIEQRGQTSFPEQLQTFKDSEGFIPKSIAGLKLIAMPQERVEGAIANSLLAIQRGEPEKIAEEFGLGVIGKRLGEVGDIFRAIDFPEPVAATAGFLISLASPLALLSKASKSIKGVSLSTDAGLLQAGKSLIKGADEAVEVIGKQVNKAYDPINDIAVDANKFLNTLSEAPPSLLKNIEGELGKNLEEILINPKIKDVRKVKQLVGEIKGALLDRKGTGLSEILIEKKVNKMYAGLKTVIREPLASSGLAKEADNILKADDAFTETIRASNFIKSKIVDKKLKLPTKAGSVAQGLATPRDVSARQAIHILKGVNNATRRNIGFAVENLDAFNKSQQIEKLRSALLRTGVAAGIGGVVGGAASKLLPRE